MLRRLALLVCSACSLAAFALAPGCFSGPPSIPRRGATRFEHHTRGIPVEEQSELWVSYQIEVEAIDGLETDYGAEGPSLYYCIVLRAGIHQLSLRLHYQAPLQIVRADESVELAVALIRGASYRLFDLNAGRRRGHVFSPWLERGAPADGSLELERPAGP